MGEKCANKSPLTWRLHVNYVSTVSAQNLNNYRTPLSATPFHTYSLSTQKPQQLVGKAQK